MVLVAMLGAMVTDAERTSELRFRTKLSTGSITSILEAEPKFTKVSICL